MQKRLGIALLAVVTSLSVGGCAPSEKELVQHLKQQWPKFDLMMSIIANEGDFKGLDCEKDNPAGMMKTLKKVCLELDLKAISLMDGGISFLRSSPGTFSGSTYKGYVFASTPLPPTAKDGTGTMTFTQVGAGWYVFEGT